MLADILGTNCDQCVSMVQYCFTSTETVRGSLGRKAQDGHLDFHTAPELCIPRNPFWPLYNTQNCCRQCSHSLLLSKASGRPWKRRLDKSFAKRFQTVLSSSGESGVGGNRQGLRHYLNGNGRKGHSLNRMFAVETGRGVGQTVGRRKIKTCPQQKSRLIFSSLSISKAAAFD